MAKAVKRRSRGVASGTLHEALDRLSARLANSRAMKPGHIVFRLTGEGGGNFIVECNDKGVYVVASDANNADRSHLVEVIGDARRIHAVLAGTKDAREQFLAGGFRIRGDLRYLSNVALELGIIKDPL